MNFVTSEYSCASSLMNIAVPKDFYYLSVSLWNDLGDAVFDVGLFGFKSRANSFFHWHKLHALFCLVIF